MLQAQFVDLDYWFRTGGVNWELVKLYQDAVAIQAGIGTWACPLLKEQVDGACANGVPYFTWWIPDITDGPMTSQVDFYLSLPGVRAAATCVDIEPPGGGTRCVNATECLTALQRIEDVTGLQPLAYSNKKYITEDLKTPNWLPDFSWWLAQWYYKVYLISYYTDYVSFLAKYANKLPQTAYDLGLTSKVIGWQITYKGNAQALCANAKTQDPINPGGIKECDLSISTIEKDAFIKRIQLAAIPPPPPPAYPIKLKTNGQINIRNAPAFGLTDIGDLTANGINATEKSGEWYNVQGWVHESVVSKV
jgi:hypothetical protein